MRTGAPDLHEGFKCAANGELPVHDCCHRDHRRCCRRPRHRRCAFGEAAKARRSRRNGEEARDTRNLAQVSELEADTRAAESEERAAAKREQLAAEQQQLAAAQHRSVAHDFPPRADEIDPDVEAPDVPSTGPVEGRTS